MAFQVSRTDTGQFVVQDPRADVVVIDDDLAVGFEKLEQIMAERGERVDPGEIAAPATGSATGSDSGGPTEGSSAFVFRGGPRYAGVLLAVILPFVWLAALYFMLASLLADQALERGEIRETEARVEALEQEVEALRSELASAPRARSSSAGQTKVSKPVSKPRSAGKDGAPAGKDGAPAGNTQTKTVAKTKPAGD